jgi:hypothetical protein
MIWATRKRPRYPLYLLPSKEKGKRMPLLSLLQLVASYIFK